MLTSIETYRNVNTAGEDQSVTESPADIELPRFSRQIDITGLGKTGEQPMERPPIGVLRPLAGILNTAVRQDQSRGTIPQLAYLTLAPLVTRELTTTDERDEQAGRSGPDTGEPTGADERADEPRVRDVLQNEDWERSASEPTTADEARRDADRSGSELATLERTVLDTQSEPPATEPGGSSPMDRTGWRSENTRDDALGLMEPPKTVVDRSDPDLDATDTSGEVTVLSEGGLVPDTGGGSVAAGQSGAATPTMTLVDEHGIGRGGTRSDTGDSSFVGDAGPGARDAARAGAGPDLTVKRTVRSAQTPETTDPGDSDTASPGSLRPGQRAGVPSTRGESSAARTVIAEDGSVNHRVLDRLYQELARKRQIERSREGR
jgi:hypothetical protein